MSQERIIRQPRHICLRLASRWGRLTLVDLLEFPAHPRRLQKGYLQLHVFPHVLVLCGSVNEFTYSEIRSTHFIGHAESTLPHISVSLFKLSFALTFRDPLVQPRVVHRICAFRPNTGEHEKRELASPSEQKVSNTHLDSVIV
jgi:hypothetical protein